MRRSLLVSIGCLFCLFIGYAQIHEPAFPDEYVPNRVLLKFREGTLPANWRASDLKTVHSLIRAFNPSRAGLIEGIDVFILDFDRPVEVPGLVEQLAQHPDVAFAEPDGFCYLVWTPNDPYLSYQWGLSKIQAFSAWDVWRGDSRFVIGVVDTGIDYTHPDLSSKYAGGRDFYYGDNDPRDQNGHGTHVSGIASAITNNALGVAGVCPYASLKVAQVCGPSGSCSISAIANGIIWATDNGAHAINLSLGSSYSYSTLQNAVNYALGRGVVVVAAAGNSNTSRKFYPAAYPGVISVGASTSSDGRASFSNYGSWVLIAAPGVSILSTWPFNRYAYLDGTSMASPHVAGAAGLIYSKITANPADRTTTNRDRVKNAILNNADWIGSWVVYGRLNLNRAVRNAFGPDLQGDVNGDGCVNDADLAEVLLAFGQAGPSRADVNNDGMVDDSDLTVVLLNFGAGC